MTRGQDLSRGKLVGLPWADTDEDKARRLLSESLYLLRKGLGKDWGGGCRGTRNGPRQMPGAVGPSRTRRVQSGQWMPTAWATFSLPFP